VAPSAPPAYATSRTRRYLMVAGLALALLLGALDQFVFATALPTVVGELGGVSSLLWVNTAYVLTGTVAMPAYGVLGDRFGRRTVLLAALAVFLVGSVVGGLAGSMPMLIAARAVQGLGGGGLLILVQAIVADVISPRRRLPYLTAIDAVFAVAAVSGPVVGGWLTDTIGWRWAFWINLPVGLVAVVAVLVLLPASARRPRPARFDLVGLLVLAAAVTLLVLVTAWGGSRLAWTSPLLLGLVLAAAVAIAVFVRIEARAADPVLPLSLLANRNVALAVGAGLLLAVAMFGTVGYLPSYLQLARGLSPTLAGLMMLTLIAGLGLATTVAAQVVRRTGRQKPLPVIGAGLVAVALAGLAALDPVAPLPQVGLCLFVLGSGIGCAWEVLVLVVQNAVPRDRVGVATAANGFFRELGVLLGTALVGALFAARLAALLAGRPPGAGPALDPRTTITPERLASLPPELRSQIAAIYADALSPVFALLVPLALLALVGLCLIRPQPLPDLAPVASNPVWPAEGTESSK
jgi:EmrB/QacA subfamily drug resistance transporter